jgi:hypothetical protein
MNALLMAMCFYYDPLSNKVLRSLRRLPWSADLQLNLFLAKCPLHEQSGHWNRWKKILNLLPAHRIAIQLLIFSPLSCSNFLAYFPLSERSQTEVSGRQKQRQESADE